MFLHELKNYDAVLEDGFTVVPIMCIVVGSIVFLIAFFGCFGAMTHQKCMLKTVSIFFSYHYIILIIPPAACVKVSLLH